MLISFLIVIISLSGCNEDTHQIVTTDYRVMGEYTPDNVRNILEKCLTQIYSAESEDDLNEGKKSLLSLCTQEEAISLNNDMGYYDATRRATVNIEFIDFAQPNKTQENKLKILAKLKISILNVTQYHLLEFVCDTDGKIESHTIWVTNNG